MAKTTASKTTTQTTTASLYEVFDTGLIFSGKKSGKTLTGWAEPQEYTPAVDPNFVWDAWSADVIVGFLNDENVYISGPQGAGKTMCVKQIAARLNWPVYEVTGHSRLEFPELCGAYHVEDGNMVWHDGPLTSAMRNGGLFMVSEQDLLDPSTAAGLNSVLDGSPLFIPELNEYITRHKLFRYVATGNSNGSGDATGTYSGVLRQNAAFASRFMHVQAQYLPRKAEKQMLMKRVAGLPEDLCEKMLELAGKIRDAYIGKPKQVNDAKADTPQTLLSVTMSPRDLIRWGKLTLAYEPVANRGHVPVLYALERAFTNRLAPAEAGAVEKLAQRVFPPIPTKENNE